MAYFEPILATISLPDGWIIKHHKLFDLEPDDPASNNAVRPSGFSLWDAYFSQDLFLAEDKANRLLIDVGWSDHADPTGAFWVCLIGWRVFEDRPPGYDWFDPLTQYRTRLLSETVELVQKLANSRSRPV